MPSAGIACATHDQRGGVEAIVGRAGRRGDSGCPRARAATRRSPAGASAAPPIRPSELGDVADHLDLREVDLVDLADG